MACTSFPTGHYQSHDGSKLLHLPHFAKRRAEEILFDLLLLLIKVSMSKTRKPSPSIFFHRFAWVYISVHWPAESIDSHRSQTPLSVRVTRRTPSNRLRRSAPNVPESIGLRCLQKSVLSCQMLPIYRRGMASTQGHVSLRPELAWWTLPPFTIVMSFTLAALSNRCIHHLPTSGGKQCLIQRCPCVLIPQTHVGLRSLEIPPQPWSYNSM